MRYERDTDAAAISRLKSHPTCEASEFWAAALLVVAGVVAVSYLRGDRRQIRLQLDALAETASVAGTESDVMRLARAARIGGFFTEDVVIRRSEDNSAFVGGRRAVAGLAAQAAAEHRTMKVSIENLEIAIADARTPPLT